MAKYSYLKLHKRLVKAGRLPAYGLCNTVRNPNRLNRLFAPETDREYNLLREDNPWNRAFWAGDKKQPGQEDWSTMAVIEHGYGPTRQNIVLLLAAMNGELNRKRYGNKNKKKTSKSGIFRSKR